MTTDNKDKPRFIVPLPGGGISRLPLAVLEAHRDDSATGIHTATAPKLSPAASPNASSPRPHKTVNIDAGGNMVTINIFTQEAPTDSGEATISAQSRDVTAHSMAVDAATGLSDWHTDWEFGECEYTDESGFVQRLQAWHRHPFGTEYAELYEG